MPVCGTHCSIVVRQPVPAPLPFRLAAFGIKHTPMAVVAQARPFPDSAAQKFSAVTARLKQHRAEGNRKMLQRSVSHGSRQPPTATTRGAGHHLRGGRNAAPVPPKAHGPMPATGAPDRHRRNCMVAGTTAARFQSAGCLHMRCASGVLLMKLINAASGGQHRHGAGGGQTAKMNTGRHPAEYHIEIRMIQTQGQPSCGTATKS